VLVLSSLIVFSLMRVMPGDALTALMAESGNVGEKDLKKLRKEARPMLSSTGRAFTEQAPWLAIFPGLAISLAVFGFNIFGDTLRDAWDPKLRRRS
jgi:ABC-type dipeptide/oligopeptide/nickel transport system permease component